MLVELSIENLGVIESVTLLFDKGFTAMTGETGAGKTMIVEAINLVVGRRADAGVVRDGAQEARVEARFVEYRDGEEVETILCRVVGAEGRSRAYVNGRMSTVAALADVGSGLVDLHGQHAHQRLLSQAAQRDALDMFGGVEVSMMLAARDHVTEIDAMLAALGGDERSRAREIDLLRFQCAEIEGATLVDPEEDAGLEREESVLADVVRHRESLHEVSAILGGDDGVIDQLSRALKSAGSVSSLGDVHVRLSSIMNEISDVSREVRTSAEGLEENPARLEEIRERRQLLRDLTKKYGDSVADVISFGVVARTRLDELEGYSERVAELASRRSRALEALEIERRRVGDARRAAAPGLAAAVEARLANLDLPHAKLSVAVGDENGDPGGDSVTFMFAANPGSSPQPLSRVASGGELARVMLALRLALSEEPGTMVFDEVDAGIGGSAAVAVANSLRELGTRHQVFAVTHLAQVAAAAHNQIAVTKEIVDGRTFGRAAPVSGSARVAEVARMLSGGLADETALAHAGDLLISLGNSSEVTQGKPPRQPR